MVISTKKGHVFFDLSFEMATGSVFILSFSDICLFLVSVVFYYFWDEDLGINTLSEVASKGVVVSYAFTMLI
jgi:hypothetical protein